MVIDRQAEMQFSRVALVTGLPLYWETPTVSAQEHAKRFGELLKWCLRLPNVHLGIDPMGVGLILRSIYAQHDEPLPANLSQRLESVGATEEERVLWPKDVELFDSHRDQLIELVRLAETHKGYAWVKPEEAEWWIKATIESLGEYAAELERNGLQTLSSPLVNRHRCTLFASFEDCNLLEHLKDVEQLKDSLDEEEYQSLYQSCVEEGENLPLEISDHSRHTVHWSWQLTNFALSHNNLVNLPLLALWSDRPSSAVRWAPPRPEAYQGNKTPLPPDKAASLLGDVLWKKFEVLFKAVSEAFKFGQALPEFTGYKSQLPVFYFANPVDPPALPQAYPEERKLAICPLVQKCLMSNNPLADEVSWGVLEHDLVALRREIHGDDNHFSCYLLLPVASGSVSGQELEEELERDLAHLALNLSLLEFSYNDMVPNVYAADIEPIKARHEARQGLWKLTLKDLESQMADSLNLLPGLGRSDAAKVYEEFEKLGELQIRVEHRLEKGRADLDDAKEEIVSGYGKMTEYYLERMAFSPLSGVDVYSLRDALLNPFAYGYLGQLLQSSRDQVDRLSSNIKLINTVQNRVSAVLVNADQRAREHLAYRTSVLGAAIGFLALFSLAEFIPGVQLGGSNAYAFPGWLEYPSQWAGSLLPGLLPGLVNIARIAMLSVGLIILIFFFYLLVRDFRSARRQKLFGIEVQRLRNLSKESREPSIEGWDALERKDEQATQLLCKLWTTTERAVEDDRTKRLLRDLRFRQSDATQFWSEQIAGWLQRGRYLRYRTDLFVLCPNEIPLPRTLCIFQYKSDSVFGERIFSEHQGMFSGQDFENSLKRAGFSEDQIRHLTCWLFERKEQIRAMSVGDFAKELDQGVREARSNGRSATEGTYTAQNASSKG